MEKIKFKRLNDLAVVPVQGSADSAGYDLYAATDYEIQIAPHKTVKIGTGLSFELPRGYFAGIFARSGLATKEGIRPANSVGVCDADYRGPYIIPLHNDGTEAKIILPGERIAQLVLLPFIPMEFEEVTELNETSRGDGCFGSTGTK